MIEKPSKPVLPTLPKIFIRDKPVLRLTNQNDAENMKSEAFIDKIIS